MAIDSLWLAEHPLFSTFSTEDQHALAQKGEIVSFRRGEVMVTADQQHEHVYWIRSGHCLVMTPANQQKVAVLAFMGPGDTFGVLAPFVCQQRGDLISLGATTAVRLPSKDVWDAVAGRPDSLQALGTLAAQWCTEREERIATLTHYTAEARLRQLLRGLALRWGEDSAQGVHIAAPLTHRVLADMAGISREKATRALGKLKQQGVLRTAGRKLIIPEPDRLVD